MKKLFAILLAVVMTFSMSVTVFADGEEKGSITITNAVPEQNYSVYCIFDLKSYDKESGAYIYTVNAAWTSFTEQAEISGEDGYISVDKNGHVSWKAGKDAAEFAKKALSYAKANSIAGKTKTAGSAAEGEETTTVEFDDLDLGYYLVDSNVGTICMLDTTKPDMSITDKNKKPSLDKKVEDGENSWGTTNGAEIGDTVKFKVTITAQDGAQKYILHEKMEQGLTFDGAGSVIVTKGSENILAENNYSVEVQPGDDCTFEVVFSDAFCDSLQEEEEIVVTYSATLNKQAKVVEGEDNSAYLSYGEKSEIKTEPKKTTTNTYQFQIIKTDSTDEEGKYKLLEGALFELYTQKTDGIPIDFVDEGHGTYRVAETNEENTITEIPAGQPILKGLDSNKAYYLEEAKAPDGYNPMDGRKEITLQGDNLAGEGAIDTGTLTYDSKIQGGVHVQNSKGNMLPSTGGIGTTIFYVVGGILVLGAGAGLILISRRGRKPADK